jgi:coenzyme PQQ precursor peptide PqqA
MIITTVQTGAAPDGVIAPGTPVPSDRLSTYTIRRSPMTWSTPKYEVVELGMEVGAYAGTA